MTEVGSRTQQTMKGLLASVGDRDVRRLVERYLEVTGDRLEQSCLEISYKCYEASSAVRSRRANGFGRNENEAQLNSLKNLLELLAEDDRFLAVAKEVVRRSTASNHAANESVSTEEDKENVVKIQLDMSKYERRSTGGSHKAPVLSNNGNYTNMSINYDLSRSKSRLKHGIENLSISALKLTQPNIALEKTQSNVEKAQPFSYEEELKKARAHIVHLEAKLKSVLDENAMLRIQAQKAYVLARDPRRETATPFPYDSKLRSTSVEGYKFNALANTSMTADSNCSQLNCSLMEDKKKSKVPRLKLEILPNYHGKSSKCINQTLLAAYQYKHGGKKS